MDLALLAELQNFVFVDEPEKLTAQIRSYYLFGYTHDVDLEDSSEETRLEYFGKIIKFYESLPKN
jgi:hypothetical protein